jgi:hypothetical protein
MNFRFDKKSGLVLDEDNQVICLTDAKNGKNIADGLHCLEIIRSLNSFAFEEWHGRYQNGLFHVFDSDGNSVASGYDALQALTNFNKE